MSDPGTPLPTAIAALVQALPTPVAILSAQAAVIACNPAFAALLDDAAPGGGAPIGQVLAWLPLDPARPTSGRIGSGPGSHDLAATPLPDGGWCVTSPAMPLERRVAEVVDRIPVGVSIFGADGRLLHANPAYHAIMAGAPIAPGDSIDAIIARRATAGEYGAGDPAELASRQRALAAEVPQHRRRQRPNGATIDISTTTLPAGGQLSIVTDVSPLVAAEAGVAERAAEMGAMLANMEHGVVLWDASRRVVAASPVAAELLGASPELLVPGRTLEEVVQSALDRGNLGAGGVAAARAQRLLEQDRSKVQHDQRLTRDGRILEVRSDPVPAGGFVTTYTNVTAHREAEDALRVAKAAAEAANAAKSRFLATMSTELRSPLATIQAAVGALARESALRVRQAAADPSGVDAQLVQRACDEALAAARHLLGMIDTVLDVARLEAGRFDVADDLVEVTHLVRACLRQSDSAAAAAEVALVVDLPEGLPSLRCDERRMRQALGHVVANAVRFTAAMGSVCIGARHEWSTGDLLLTVQDTGTGIPPEALERVFEPFTQLDAPQRQRSGGAGLGLYVGRTLMRAHGGDLTLRSVPGQGTTATIRIPAERVVHADSPLA